MDKERLIKAVHSRMAAEKLTQRGLAHRIGASQGHLSKVLRGAFLRESRVVRQLETFVAIDATPPTFNPADNKDDIEKVVLTLADQDPELMHILHGLMQCLVRRARPETEP
jgi:transcriptional regulator with XRE-family HTH domain